MAVIQEDPDLYALLNVPRTASAGDIQKAYKTLSRTFHPDKQVDAKEAADKAFVKIKQAHDVLMDRILRMAYDIGGILAVQLVRRSQESSQSQKAREEDYVVDDLYEKLLKLSPSQAKIVLQEAVNEYERQKAVHGRSNWDTNVENILYWGDQMSVDSATLNFQSQRTVHESADVTFGVSSQRKRSGVTTMSPRVGVEYRPIRGTSCVLDGAFSATSPSMISFRTSRRLANQTFMMLAVGGDTNSWDSLSYSLISSRNLLIGEERVQATWRAAIKPKDQQLGMLMASFRNLSTPQWKVRLSLGASPFKVSYRWNDISLSYTWSIVTSGYKAAAEQIWGDWTFKYGVKYDGQDWSLIFRLFTDDWNVRIPVKLSPWNDWPVAWLITILVGQYLDHHLEELSRPFSTKQIEFISNAPTTAPQFSSFVKDIAEKKRRREESTNGLILLQATWFPGDNSVLDTLQFWVIDGQLQVHATETFWWPERVVGPSSWRWLLPQWMQRGDTSNDSTEKQLYIRYRYQSCTYELWFRANEWILLPNPRASVMGNVT